MNRLLAGLVALIEIALLPIAFFFALMGVMIFDAPGSDDRWQNWLAFLSAWALVIALVVGARYAIAAAKDFTQRRMVLALVVPGVAGGLLAVALGVLG